MNEAAAAIHILIVDDEAPARKRLRDVLSDCAAALPLTVAGEAANGIEALEMLGSHQVDVVLLDIRMPGMDGIEVAEHAQKLPAPPAIIFTTAFDNYAIKAFEVSAIDYLLKPIRRERLLEALGKAQALTASRLKVLHGMPARPRSHLSVAERGKVLLIPLGDIVYLRSELKYVTIRTLAHEYLLEESLTHLEQEFGAQFMRIHRNCLVARDYIEGFEKAAEPGEGDTPGAQNWVVLLRGLAEKLPLSRRQNHIIREFKRG